MKRIATLLLTLAATTPLIADDAAAIFKSKCQACHGVNGAGDSPMARKLGVKPLGSADVQKQTNAQLATIINKGKNKMPPFETKLAAGQADALVALIRSFKK